MNQVDNPDVHFAEYASRKHGKTNDYWSKIPGFFDFRGLYSHWAWQLPSGCKFVEVGSWKGKSAAYMCVEIINSGKNIKFDCIDTFKGSLDEDVHQEDPDVVNDRLMDVFIENMKPVEGLYNAKRMTSLEAAQTYEDGSLDLIWIDASHEYEDVKDDIQAWLPKVKKGGFIGGDDYAPNWPGVVQAVTELMPNSIHNEGPYWYQRIDS